MAVALATYEPTGTGGDSALLVGVLVDSEGCLAIQEADSGRFVLPVWPDASISGDELVLHDGRYVLGDTIQVGGGFAPTLTSRADIPQECEVLDLDAWVVSQD